MSKISGVKGRSGRKPNLKTVLDKALLMIDADIEGIIGTLIKKALDGDRDSAIYLLDRRLGRPRQEIDQRVSAIVKMTPEEYETVTRIAMVEEGAMLLGTGIDITEEDNGVLQEV